jgi:hypothetical protein
MTDCPTPTPSVDPSAADRATARPTPLHTESTGN